MKIFKTIFVIWVCVGFSLLVIGCRHVDSDQGLALGGEVAEPLPHLKYKMDGSFDGWTNFSTAQTAKNFDWDQLKIHSQFPDVAFLKIRQFFYDRDDNYLYVFFRLDRTLDQIYGKKLVGFGFGELYFDLDGNTNTGCGDHEQSGRALVGSEVRIQISGGFYAENDGVMSGAGRSVYYDEADWNSVAERFNKDIKHQDSIHFPRFIAYGKDGIELAVPIDTLKTKDGRFNMAYWPEILPQEHVNWTLVDLRK